MPSIRAVHADSHKVARVTNDRTIANALLIESGLAGGALATRRPEAVGSA